MGYNPLSVPLISLEVSWLADSKISQIWKSSYEDFSCRHHQSGIQEKASHAILNCKTGKLGCSISQCTDCGHMEIHNNSCRNRNCPNCQAVLKEVWVDKRRAEVIDSFMWCLHFPMNSIPSFTVTRSFSTVFCTGAPPKHSLSYQGIRSISAQHQASFRFSIPGIRNWITMCTSTVLFPAEGLPPTRKSVNPKAGFSFR